MSPQAGFLLQDQVVPRLKSAIPNVVHCVGAEDHQELIQDATAMAARMMHKVGTNVKKPEYHQRTTARNQQKIGG
jgi:hypothetical protein